MLEQVHLAFMRSQARACLIQRLVHARFEVHRMKPVQDQETRHEFIASQLLDDALASIAGRADQIQHSFESGSVQIHHQLHQLLHDQSAGWDRRPTRSCPVTAQSIGAAVGTPVLPA